MNAINIFDQNTNLELKKGYYHIYLKGGWGITLNQFELILTDSSSKEIKPLKTKFPVQTIDNGRTKRILSIDILETDTYSIEFKNQETLKVFKSPLSISQWFSSPIDNKLIEVYFEHKG